MFYLKISIKKCLLVCIIFFLYTGQAYSQDGTLRILVTGFEAFGGNETNPTEQLVNYINKYKKTSIDGITLKGITLPVIYFRSWQVLKKEINCFKPDYVLSFGYDSNSNSIEIESIARNYDGGIRDNSGKKHLGRIIKGGENTFESELPIMKIKNALKNSGFPTLVSNNAGGYLCNHIFYCERFYSDSRIDIRSGFFHVPNWEVQGDNGLWEALKRIMSLLHSDSMKIGVIEFEPIKNNADENIKRINHIILETKKLGISFLIFPEMALSGLIFTSPRDLLDNNVEFIDNFANKKLEEIAMKNNIYLSIGIPFIHHKKLFNSYRIYSPKGLVYTYKKNHLYDSDFNWAERGKTYPVIKTDFGKIGTLICHDVVYKESFKRYVEKEINLLIIGTNWIGRTPITKYIRKYAHKEWAILVSDRNGREKSIDFHGNTCVIVNNKIYQPTQILEGINGIVYLAIIDTTSK